MAAAALELSFDAGKNAADAKDRAESASSRILARSDSSSPGHAATAVSPGEQSGFLNLKRLILRYSDPGIDSVAKWRENSFEDAGASESPG
jgi:hypothetical protein